MKCENETEEKEQEPEMKETTESKTAACIRGHLPCLITLTPLHLIAFSRTFSYHHV